MQDIISIGQHAGKDFSEKLSFSKIIFGKQKRAHLLQRDVAPGRY